MYVLTWKNPAVDPGKNPAGITVPVGSTVSNQASLTFTGKGSANYGKIQQENLLRLLESFADGTPPDYATVGQLWFDTDTGTLKVYADSAPPTWKAVGGLQVRDAAEGPPPNPQLGDMWFERTGPLSGYLYVYTGIGRFPYSLTTNGGWAQVWPRVDAAGLREELDQVADLAETLSTDRSYVVGRLFTQLPSLTLLDADLEAKRALTPDPEVNSTGSTGLQVQPVSHDWDALLSMCRWLVSRLDIPLDSWQDVSSHPFVQDGRQVRSYLVSSYASSDPRATSEARRAGRHLGTISLHRLYTETINILSAAAPFRYTLRGIAGGSGTNSDLAPDVATRLHCRRAGAWVGGSPVTANTLFRWSSGTDRDRFIAGGSAIEVTVRLVGGGSAEDTALAAFLSDVGLVRVTADAVRWLNSAATPVMTVAPTTPGLLAVTSGSGTVALGSIGVGGRWLTVSGTTTSTGFNLTVSVNSPAGLTGALQVTFGTILDRTTYGSTELPLYPAPLAYDAGTDAGGTDPVLADVGLTAAPTADFTVNGTTGPTFLAAAVGAPVTFAYTGSGSPSLIEWDFDGDGTFTGSGATATHTYTTAGTFSPRVRVTNAGGSDVLFRPGKVRVS